MTHNVILLYWGLIQPSEKLPTAADRNKYRAQQPDITQGERPQNIQLKMGCLHLVPPCQSSGNPMKRGGKSVRTRADGGHKENKATGQSSHDLTETEAASTGPTWVCIYTLTFSLGFFKETSECVNKHVSGAFTFTWGSSLLLLSLV